jgi:hypothetical protein
MAKTENKNIFSAIRDEIESEPVWLRIGDVVTLRFEEPEKVEINGKFGMQKLFKMKTIKPNGDEGALLVSRKQFVDIANAFEKAGNPDELTYVRRS